MRATLPAMKVRSSFSAIVGSRAATTCMVFVLVLAPIAVVLLNAYRVSSNGTLRTLYAVAVVAPVAGIVIALVSVLVLGWRARRIVLKIDHHVSVKKSGVRFLLTDLGAVQVWTRQDGRGCTITYLALLPVHVDERLSAASLRNQQVPGALADYVVRFPRGARPSAYEVVDNLRQARPELYVEKLGAV